MRSVTLADLIGAQAAVDGDRLAYRVGSSSRIAIAALDPAANDATSQQVLADLLSMTDSPRERRPPSCGHGPAFDKRDVIEKGLLSSTS